MVEGGTAIYGEVLPSPKLSYVSQSCRVEEVTMLKGIGAPSELTYQLSDSTGLEPREKPDGRQLGSVSSRSTRERPVTIDPTVDAKKGTSCGPVVETPKAVFCSQSTMQVGYDDATHEEHHAGVEQTHEGFELPTIKTRSARRPARSTA